MENKGYIYILTNPSFKEYVKIGYADNVENRLRQLNNSECTPFAFRVYATYEVEDRLTDVNLHKLIDQLNPNLRSIDNVNGKKRVREFYAMSPEQAYSILESIALLGGRKNRLKLWNVTEEERKDIEVAQEIEEEHIERLSPFAFSKCNIEKLKQKINEIIGVTCFAERPDNVLMWSHYANKHTGFCVEYDFSKLKSIEAKSMLFPVIYSKNRAVLPLGLFDFSDIKNVKLVENSLPIPEIVEALLIKSEVWQYEEEWRIICFLKNLNEQKLVENMISKVYLGANINEENEKLISELAKAKEVPVEKFKVSPETFELKIQIDG